MYIFKRKTGGGENGIVVPLFTMMCGDAYRMKTCQAIYSAEL